MAPTVPAKKPAEKMDIDSKPKATKGVRGGKGGKVEKVKKGKPRNYELASGIYRFSKSKMFHKKAKYRFLKKKHPKVMKPKKPTHIEKPIGGEKNGGKRLVLVKKRRSFYPTAQRINRHQSKKTFKQHKRYTRKSLKPGKILVLLAGIHKGKRVVLLKVLKSGLLLVTGPFKINGCPLRRISQNYVIATSTRLNVSAVRIPEHITDGYFKRNKPKKSKKVEGDIFATKKEGYKASEKRKTDQKVIDDQVLKVIAKHPEKNLMKKYLSSMFGLKKTQFPHRVKF
ncbi:UNVERIFIED_CONTAM: hypothetical protein PYX00_009644 [Menopon gallinae]|uniref:Large ribosomal subunit protein eL6 n=1 Tax=Menopon gallinae TaxID=328185 RepID=A0AAW2HCE4_9NEOP